MSRPFTESIHDLGRIIAGFHDLLLSFYYLCYSGHWTRNILHVELVTLTTPSFSKLSKKALHTKVRVVNQVISHNGFLNYEGPRNLKEFRVTRRVSKIQSVSTNTKHFQHSPLVNMLLIFLRELIHDTTWWDGKFQWKSNCTYTGITEFMALCTSPNPNMNKKLNT